MNLVDAHGEPAATPEASGMVRVYVWDAVVRICHWTIFLSMIVLAVTGIYIGRPWFQAPGEAGQHFVTGTYRVLHLYGAIAFTLAVLSRILWLFIGTTYARLPQFVPFAADRRRDLVGTFLFYTFVKRDAPPVVGHNPLASSAYLLVFGLYLVMILTGLGMWAVFAPVGSWVHLFGWVPGLVGGLQMNRWLHHAVMWLLIGFFIHHLYSALLVTHLEKNGTLESIFSGYKWFKKDGGE
jgi:Ni/Fe-hydrogenase 1 B-type cytochrome subunit